MKTAQSPRIEIKHNNCAADDPCALCGSRTDPVVGLELFLDGTYSHVCRECARKIDPAKLRWRDWANEATAQAAGPPAAYPPGHRMLDFRTAGPVEQPLQCPVCEEQDVQLVSLMCSMADGRVMYLDSRGLQIYGTDMPGGFRSGATLSFRCSENHVFFRHLGAMAGHTCETELGAYAGPGVMSEMEPLWTKSRQPESDARSEVRTSV